jgi:iron complex outermembrane receptor protein
MKQLKLASFVSSLWLSSAIAVSISPPIEAQIIEPIQINEIRLEPTETGFDIILVTVGGVSPTFSETKDGNTLIIEVSDAQLSLSDGSQRFQADGLVSGITTFKIEQQGDNVVITIVGLDNQPIAAVKTDNQGLLVSLSESEDILGEETEDEGIVIVATQEAETEDNYVPPQETSVTRDNTPILDTPQSINVVPEPLIRDQNNNSVGEILRNVPGVTTGRGPSGGVTLTPVIRGFESENILRNGLRDDTQRFFGGITTNVERIEVLKGPASILFGAGNLGGTVNIVTKSPLSEPQYNIEFSVGQFDLYRPVIDFGGPLTSDGKILSRLVFSYESRDTFQDFGQIDRQLLFAPAVAIQLSEKSKLLLEGEYVDIKTRQTAPELPASGTVIRNPDGSLNRRLNLGEPSLTESESYVGRFSYRFEHQFNEQWQLKNEFLMAKSTVPELTGSNFILPVSLGPDNRTLTRLFAENPIEYDNYTLNTNVIGEIQATDWMTHKLLFGVEYAYEENRDDIIFSFIDPIDIFEPVYSPNSVRNRLTFQDFYSSLGSWGFYLQDQITFVDKLILAVGARGDIAEQNFIDDFREQRIYRQDNLIAPRVGLIYKSLEM